MALEVRRIVTGHDASGKAIVASDERLHASTRPGRAGIARCDVWSSDGMPVDLSDAAAEKQKQGFVVRHNYVGSGQGTVVFDYGIILSGECDLELDDGKTLRVRQGDIVVQRGTMHAWVNNGTQPCVFAFVLIDANPAQADGQILRTHYPS
jgi:hypothetical protein